MSAGGGGNRFSSGAISSAPTGATPTKRSAPTQQSAMARGNPARRGTSQAPTSAPTIIRVIGAATNHMSFEARKNIDPHPTLAATRRRDAPGRAPPRATHRARVLTNPGRALAQVE